MKRKIIILLAVLLTTGCTIVRIDTNSIENIMDVILSKDNTLYNQVGKGYKYYIPACVSYIDTNEYNDKLYSNGIYYYLHIDIVNYYNKSEYDYEEDATHYFSKKIDLNNKKGYLDIIEENNKYYIKFAYNYAFLETVVEKDDINEVILNASYILSTVKFNDDIVELLLNGNFMNEREEKYDLFKSKGDSTNFLKYEEENVETEEG